MMHANNTCTEQKGKTSLGDAIYRSITEDTFDPVEFLAGMDLSTEHKVLDLKNRIEASTVIWKRKMQTNKDSKSSWSSIVSFEKREQFEERAETILHLLKLQFPGTPQSQLDISKIQYNRVYIISSNIPIDITDVWIIMASRHP